jgi:hypothetical protein
MAEKSAKAEAQLNVRNVAKILQSIFHPINFSMSLSETLAPFPGQAQEEAQGVGR